MATMGMAIWPPKKNYWGNHSLMGSQEEWALGDALEARTLGGALEARTLGGALEERSWTGPAET